MIKKKKDSLIYFISW